MTPVPSGGDPDRPALLCFDGSEDAAAAIARAGAVLRLDRAVVLTVWEPFPSWEPSDPATIISAPLSKLASRALELDEVVRELAEEKLNHGLALATSAGFNPEGRTARGKPWRAICHLADEIDAATIVMGARGLSPAKSILLGSVSSAVAAHARRPVLIVPHTEHNPRRSAEPA